MRQLQPTTTLPPGIRTTLVRLAKIHAELDHADKPAASTDLREAS